MESDVWILVRVRSGVSPSADLFQLGNRPVDSTPEGVDRKTVGVGVLGPLQFDGRENGLSPRDRVVVSAMVVRAGDPVSTDALADALWGNTPSATWTKVVQGSVVHGRAGSHRVVRRTGRQPGRGR